MTLCQNTRRLAAPFPVAVGLLSSVACSTTEESAEPPYTQMATHIVTALQPAPGERAILRHDPNTLPGFAAQLEQLLEVRGVDVELMKYGMASDFEGRLNEADVYVWLPVASPLGTPPDQLDALGQWLDAGRGRQIHFHWGAGTMGTDGVAGEHSAAYDQVYVDALDIDHERLDREQERAIATLRSGEVRVRTPAGTDIRFRVGDRPFNKQNGDASAARMASARIRIDREIELPAGVIRVAPIETSVEGAVVVLTARFNGTEVENLRLEFRNGKVTRISASAGATAAQEAIAASSALGSFREFGLGFNPKLTTPPGHEWLPYYGYGAGVVRLSLGDNSELGGAVTGDAVRWFFFPDATVTVGDTPLVERGRLVQGGER